MADVPPLQLFVNGVEVDQVEWSFKTEEVLGGVGQISGAIQDRTNTWDLPARAEVKAVIRATGWVLGRGEIVRPEVELEVGMPFRTWKFSGSDVNAQMPERKVGALDGKIWKDEGGFGVFMNIDPFATSLKTDKLTVQQLFDHYFRFHGQAIETSTYVGEFLSDFRTITWNYSDLQQALTDMAALIVSNLQFWIDPALFAHWVLIPAWQDLAQEIIDVEENPETSVSPLGFPEGSLGLLQLAPYELTGADGGEDPDNGIIGHQRLTFAFDGQEMPDQIYVRGGTGYVYNSPALSPVEETKTVVKAPIPGSDATYELTFLSNTKIWHTDSTGYISLTYETASAGGPYDVKYIQVPWSESRHKGGGFWKLLTGPYVGKLVDNDTNIFSGYGSIRVEAVDSAAGDPQVGVGGSGWVNEVDQDPNKRQAYMQAPISTTRALRDAYGGQALARGQTPTLRGSVEVVGYDGWRAGQLLKISDDRLPSYLNGRYFVIQRVQTSFLAETELRKYVLDWGDGPVSRWSGQPTFDADVEWPPGATQIVVDARDLSPGPNSTQIISGQLVNLVGEPWAIEGKVVEWRFECYNEAGILQTGQGSIDPTVSITDKGGRARTRLTTGPGTALVYYVFARVKAV